MKFQADFQVFGVHLKAPIAKDLVLAGFERFRADNPQFVDLAQPDDDKESFILSTKDPIEAGGGMVRVNRNDIFQVVVGADLTWQRSAEWTRLARSLCKAFAFTSIGVEVFDASLTGSMNEVPAPGGFVARRMLAEGPIRDLLLRGTPLPDEHRFRVMLAPSTMLSFRLVPSSGDKDVVSNPSAPGHIAFICGVGKVGDFNPSTSIEDQFASHIKFALEFLRSDLASKVLPELDVLRAKDGA